MIDELERNYRGLIDTLPKDLSGGTEKSHKKLQSSWPVSVEIRIDHFPILVFQVATF
jgi:hypothetical protein